MDTQLLGRERMASNLTTIVCRGGGGWRRFVIRSQPPDERAVSRAWIPAPGNANSCWTQRRSSRKGSSTVAVRGASSGKARSSIFCSRLRASSLQGMANRTEFRSVTSGARCPHPVRVDQILASSYCDENDSNFAQEVWEYPWSIMIK